MPTAVAPFLIALALVAGCVGRQAPEPIARADSVGRYTERAAPLRPPRVPLAPLDPLAAARPEPPPALPAGFVRLAEVAPQVAQEMRYAGAYNFVGERIDGYEAPTCILARPAAEALARVDADLAARGLGLKVYDCYRPQTAVNHFARWARSGDEAMKRGFFPDEPTRLLFRRGYIASRSGHSRGATVDLTLVRRPAEASVRTRYPEPPDLPRCDRDRDGAEARFDDGDLDMGTAFDCLSRRAARGAAVPPAARRNRETLRRAMERRGFRNYAKEWWHFTLRDEPFPGTYFDFAVE